MRRSDEFLRERARILETYRHHLAADDLFSTRSLRVPVPSTGWPAYSWMALIESVVTG